jgi:hypothetical protein
VVRLSGFQGMRFSFEISAGGEMDCRTLSRAVLGVAAVRSVAI